MSGDDVHLVLGLSMVDNKESLCLVKERSGNVKSLRKHSRLITLTNSGVWG